MDLSLNADECPMSMHSPSNAATTIEHLLKVKYVESTESDFATTIRNAILIPNNLNVSDDCLRLLCNNGEPKSSDSDNAYPNSETISNQDYPGANDIISCENTMIETSGPSFKVHDHSRSMKTARDTIIGHISQTPKNDYVVIQIEPEYTTELTVGDPKEVVSVPVPLPRSPELFECLRSDVPDLKPEINSYKLAKDQLMERNHYLLGQIQTALSGIIPPPAVTNACITSDIIISKYKQHDGQMLREKFYKEKSPKYINSPDEAQTQAWPEIKSIICHDVNYNLSSATEQFEYLTVKYVSRFIGADTASSFVMADLSSAKKRSNRTKALQVNSPGRRLSHLARRRVIFSCANLLGTNTTTDDPAKLKHRQILLPRRMKGRTPSRKRKTPSSSAKKREASAAPGTLVRATSKRCLFQSPGTSNDNAQQQPPTARVTTEVANRVDRSKRALFASPRLGAFSSDVFGKRKRMDCSDDEENREQQTKLQRTEPQNGSESLKRRNQFMRSQSFKHLSKEKSCEWLPRTSSEMNISSFNRKPLTLTDSEKKKLLWNVSQTLQRNHVGGNHPNFKDYATVMAKVVKRLYLENSNRDYNASEQMTKLANRIAFQVIQGKKEVEIYSAEKRKHQNVFNPLKGYVNPEEYQIHISRVKAGVTPHIAKTSSIPTTQVENWDQGKELLSNAVLDNQVTAYNVLRENVDIEHRRSSSKNMAFSGKDQKNVSPYSGGDGGKRRLLVGGATTTTGLGKGLNVFKAKRQISFDT